MSDPRNITKAEGTAAEEEVADAVKAALLISGADKRRYGRLKEQLANNYLLGTDQYPDTLEKASRILGNYQVPTNHLPCLDGAVPFLFNKDMRLK